MPTAILDTEDYIQLAKTVDKAIRHRVFPGLSSHPYHDMSYALSDMAAAMFHDDLFWHAVCIGDYTSVSMLLGYLREVQFAEQQRRGWATDPQWNKVPLVEMLVDRPAWHGSGITTTLLIAAWCEREGLLTDVLHDLQDTIAAVDSSEVPEHHYPNALGMHVNLAMYSAVTEHGYVADRPTAWQAAMYVGSFLQHVCNRAHLQTILERFAELPAAEADQNA